MIDIEGRTIADAVGETVRRHGPNPFLLLSEDQDRPYHPTGGAITYEQAGDAISSHAAALRRAGYGHGHRIAFLLANRPEMMLLKLACAEVGVSWVPINPAYRAAEMAYVLQDSGADLVVAANDQLLLADAAIEVAGGAIRRLEFAEGGLEFPPPDRPAPIPGPVGPGSEASLLYTSGTTGRPKGCVLGHAYELEVGAWYATRGGRLAFADGGGERIYNPLPLFHVNAGICSFYGMLLTGNAQVVTDRFSRRNWWREIRESGATGIHYLGIVIPMLMNEPPGPLDRDHGVRFGVGAGVEPTLHAAFEERFGFPLVELWGMTEMCRVLADCHEPRAVHTRAMGRPGPGLEVRVVDQDDRDVAVGDAGEMVLRHSAETPRRGAFSGYLNLRQATEEAWRGGWFHTGDTVTRDESGMLYFVDRKKNIIRRSGENIAAAEVEAVLQAHDHLGQVAVLAIEDELREEEVMACIVTRDVPADAATARALFDHCFAELAYYKAPGWIVFVDEIPLTGTQKIQKHMILAEGEDPRIAPGAHDLRDLKRR